MRRALTVLITLALMILSYGLGVMRQAVADDQALMTLDSLNALAPTVTPHYESTIPDSRRSL